MGGDEDRLKALELALPGVSAPMATYVGSRQAGHILYISGQGPHRPDGTYHRGLVGAYVTTEQAYEHARLKRLGLLAVARAAAGTLDWVYVLKLFGMVRVTPEFADHPKVIDGCSDLFEAVLGEDGRHARSAVGMGSLPNGMTVEIECVLGLKD